MTGSTLAADSAADLKWLVDSLEVFAERGHDKMTVRQLLFFLAVSHRSTLSTAVTLSDIRARYPLGRSIEKSKIKLLEPDDENADGLGWLHQETDLDDRRQRYLSVGDEGAAVLDALPDRPLRLTIADILRRLREGRGAP